METCRHCGLTIRHLGNWINAWLHLLTRTIWCDIVDGARARPE